MFFQVVSVRAQTLAKNMKGNERPLFSTCYEFSSHKHNTKLGRN